MKIKYYSDYYFNYNAETMRFHSKQIHNRLIGIDKHTALCILNDKYYLCNAKNLYEQYSMARNEVELFFMNNKIHFFHGNVLLHFIYVKRIKDITPYLHYIIEG